MAHATPLPIEIKKILSDIEDKIGDAFFDAFKTGTVLAVLEQNYKENINELIKKWKEDPFLSKRFVYGDEEFKKWLHGAFLWGEDRIIANGFSEGEGIALLTWKAPYGHIVEETEEFLGSWVEVYITLPSFFEKLLSALKETFGKNNWPPDLQSDSKVGQEDFSSFETDPPPQLEEKTNHPQGKEGRKKEGGERAHFLKEIAEEHSPFKGDLSLTALRDILPERRIVDALPEGMARREGILPYASLEDGSILVLVTEDSPNIYILDTIRLVLKAPMKLYKVPQDYFEYFLQKAYPFPGLVKEQEQPFTPTPEPEIVSQEDETGARKIVSNLLRLAVVEDVSDIHFEPRRREAVVRMRIDGVLHEQEKIPKEIYQSVASVIKIHSGMDISEKRLPQDGRYLFFSGGKIIRFRVSTVPTPHGERIVMRLLKESDSIPEIEQLGFLDDTLEKFKEVISKPYGLILITGPTGSGKSFTNFSVLKRISTPERNVLTVEDPIEYEIPGISQVQVNEDAGLTFARVLRAFLRQDPDVIMVGEVRDDETANIAVDAAMTGHLVLATLHTNDSFQALFRMEELGVSRFNVASSLIGVLSQRLVRKVCKNCAREVAEEKLIEYKKIFEQAGIPFPEDGKFVEGAGCSECRHTGYKGRTAIHELLFITPKIRIALYEATNASELRKIATEEGVRTLLQDGLIKASRGITTVREVLAKALE